VLLHKGLRLKIQSNTAFPLGGQQFKATIAGSSAWMILLNIEGERS
jgi:hypothetical protein